MFSRGFVFKIFFAGFMKFPIEVCSCQGKNSKKGEKKNGKRKKMNDRPL